MERRSASTGSRPSFLRAAYFNDRYGEPKTRDPGRDLESAVALAWAGTGALGAGGLATMTVSRPGAREKQTGIRPPRIGPIRTLAPSVFYIAFRDESVESIRGYAAIRRQLERMLDVDGAAALLEAAASLPPRHPWIDALCRFLKRLADLAGRILDRALRVFFVGLDGLVMILRFGPFTTLKAARKVFATLDRLWYARLFNLLTFNSLPPPEHPYSELDPAICGPCTPQAPGDEVVSASRAELTQPSREDRIAQNQLTLVTVVEARRLKELRAVMATIELYSRRLAPAGSLAGISTIHFVRWLIIDGGKRLVMLSDYDGSWEAYIGEFAEMILSGLDAIWGSAVGYPRSGAQDLAAFKRFLRCHQIQSEVFFSAYPTKTVLNVIDDRQIARCVAEAKGAREALASL